MATITTVATGLGTVLDAPLRPIDVHEDWRVHVPVLASSIAVLREVRTSDATSLLAMLTTPEMTRFISRPPSTVEGFERFILAMQRLRAAGDAVCFAVTMRGSDTAVGIVQVRRLGASTRDGAMHTAEWGFTIGSPFWGTGLFEESARLVIAFAFECLQVQRLEARTALKNTRAARALQKVGAVAEGMLPEPLACDEGCLEQVLYTITEGPWRARIGGATFSRLEAVH